MRGSDQVFRTRRSKEMDLMRPLGWRASSAVMAIHHMEWFYPGHRPTCFRSPHAGGRCHFGSTSRPPGCAGIRSSPEPCNSEWTRSGRRGESPFVLTPTYGLASTLSFYLPGQPADLLPELELRDDGQAGQPARPLASQPAPRSGRVSEIGPPSSSKTQTCRPTGPSTCIARTSSAASTRPSGDRS